MSKWQAKLRELFGIDIRSLVVFRVGLAVVLLADLFMRLQDLKAHYTDEGVFPRFLLGKIGIENLSLHLLSGSWEFQLILFVLAIVFAVFLLIGFQTKLVTILSWFFLISLHLRNPLVLSGGDKVLQMLLFWAMFLPLGAWGSIDFYFNKTKRPESQILSAATVGLLLQICFIYLFTALLKGDSWWHSGTAAWYSLMNSDLAYSSANVLLQFPYALKVLTFLTIYFEAFGPFFAFVPFYTGPIRFTVVVFFILFHLLGLNLLLSLGIFSYVCAVAWIVFIPAWFWDKIWKLQDVPTYRLRANILSNGFAIFFIGYIFLSNLVSLHITVPMFSSIWVVGNVLKINQRWGMFAPNPVRIVGWYVIPGKLSDGSEVDLFNKGSPVTWEKPSLVSSSFKNMRWRKYMGYLWKKKKERRHALVYSYSKYLCRQWNENHPPDKQLLELDIFFMQSKNDIDGQSSTINKRHLGHHVCSE